MSATTHLVPVDGTSAVAAAVTAPARDHLVLQTTLAVVLGVVAALLATWAVRATMTLQMSF